MASHRNRLVRRCALNPQCRRPARRLWRLHGRGLHPQTPGRAWPSPLRPERPAAPPPLLLTSGEGMGHAPMSTPNATRAPCFVNAFLAAVAPLQGSTRGAVAQPHTTPPARPVKQVFGGRRRYERRQARPRCRRHRLKPRAACRRGDTARPQAAQAHRRMGRSRGHACPPLGGWCLLAVHLLRSRRCKKEKAPNPHESSTVPVRSC